MDVCILTSERVLCTSFAGQNHLFRCFSMFAIFFRHKPKKPPQKITEKHAQKGGLPSFKFYSYLWLTPTSQSTPGENVILFKFYKLNLLSIKITKTLFSTEKRFRPTNGMWSTCLLVKIHNRWTLTKVGMINDWATMK